MILSWRSCVVAMRQHWENCKIATGKRTVWPVVQCEYLLLANRILGHVGNIPFDMDASTYEEGVECCMLYLRQKFSIEPYQRTIPIQPVVRPLPLRRYAAQARNHTSSTDIRARRWCASRCALSVTGLRLSSNRPAGKEMAAYKCVTGRETSAALLTTCHEIVASWSHPGCGRTCSPPLTVL